MAGHDCSVTAGFHDGELAVQRRAGVRGEADRLAGMLAEPDLRGGASRFLADRTFAALTARDRAGRLWSTALSGPRGFLDAHDARTLKVHAGRRTGDPLHRLAPGQPAGLLAIDFATRRRMRINGTLTTTSATGLEIRVDQAYGNCPQYIQRRVLMPRTTDDRGEAAGARPSRCLAQDAASLIRRCDTFVLGTTHPLRGNDASHRGGPPGFVRVEQHDGRDTLWWPDYPGNNLFNSLGNLAVDDTAALLFTDFDTGDTVHLSGTAALDWTTAGAAGDDGGTGRRVVFRVQSAVAGPPLPLRADDVVRYPHNPPLTDKPTSSTRT